MDIPLDEPLDKPKKTALQQIQEQTERQIRPLRNIKEMPDLVKRYSPGYQQKKLMPQLELHRQTHEMLKRSEVLKHIQDIVDGSSIGMQAKRMMEQYFPKGTFAGLRMDIDTVLRAAGLDSFSSIAKQYEQYQKPISENQELLEKLRYQAFGGLTAASLGIDNDTIQRVAGLASLSSIAKQYEQYQRPISENQELLEKLRYQAFGGLSAVNFARQLEVAPALRAMEGAKKSLDRLRSSLQEIDFSQFEANEEDEKETKQAVESITQAVAEQKSFQEAVERIVLSILVQQKPKVQWMLWLFFCKVVDWLIAGAIGAAMGQYAPVVLGESPHAAKMAVQENARAAVGSPLLLMEYRYVSAKVLIVRQNPRARSPEVGRLAFSQAVKLLKKEKDFTLVLWTDKESGAEIQGWVFSRYLGKFS